MIVFTQFENKPLLFQKPKSIISCKDQDRFEPCFQKIEEALKKGQYVAGFFSYEAGYCFEERLRKNKKYDFPLLYLGVYESPRIDHPHYRKNFPGFRLTNPRLNISLDEYKKNIERIRSHIGKGDVYQITYCIKLKFKCTGDPFSLYEVLLKEQPVPYPAYIQTDEFCILSCSPELFIKKQLDRVMAKPMKGTWPRHTRRINDLIGRLRFQRDVKNRAENVMIADLLRNDLGKIACAIKTPRLFEIARYKKLYQMTSTVTGAVDPDISIYALFSSLFPSGSVTGAPKIRSMGIISALENEDRRIYTGAIGYITPDKNLFFNIPIRTILIRQDQAEMGIGGGIVWDSTPEGEWAEGLLKARFLTDIMIANSGPLE